MKIEISAPGKTILTGEHAVVYGKAAIAASLSLNTHLTVVSCDENKVILNLKNLGLQKEWSIKELNETSECAEASDASLQTEECVKGLMKSFLINISMESESQKLAVVAFLYLWIHLAQFYKKSLPPSVITVDSELPIGSGMGSSASYCVCVSTAILLLCEQITPELLPENKRLVNKWAFEAEKIFHGKPSGIDNTVITYGGAVLFQNGTISNTLSTIQDINILLVDTKVSRNTKTMVAVAKKKRELYPSIFNGIMETIDAISQHAWKLLQDSIDLEPTTLISTFQDLTRINHNLLNALGVSHPKLNIIYDIAEKNNCAAKLTGAGGGGSAIVVLPLNKGNKSSLASKLKIELRSHDFDVYDVYLGSTGLKMISYEN